MVLIKEINDTTFSINGVPYKKIFVPVAAGSSSVRIASAYDSSFEVLPITKFDEVSVDGDTYTSQADLIDALIFVVFTRISTGFQGKIQVADTPIEDGYYLAIEAGTYTNAGGIVVSAADLIGNEVRIYKSGGTYTKEVKPLSASSAISVVNNLLSSSTSNALSANMGMVLNEKIQSVDDFYDQAVEAINDTLQDDYIQSIRIGQVNGVAPLNALRKIDSQYINFTGYTPKGSWDASTGNPPTATPQEGWVYDVIVAGNTDLAGASGTNTWALGDEAYYAGGKWNKRKSLNTELYEGLDSTSNILGLAANQGPIIKTLIDSLEAEVSILTTQADTIEADLSAIVAITSSLQEQFNLLLGIIPTEGASKVTREEINIDVGTYSDDRFSGLSIGQIRLQYSVEMPGKIGNLLMGKNIELNDTTIDFGSSSMQGVAYLERLIEE